MAFKTVEMKKKNEIRKPYFKSSHCKKMRESMILSFFTFSISYDSRTIIDSLFHYLFNKQSILFYFQLPNYSSLETVTNRNREIKGIKVWTARGDKYI